MINIIVAVEENITRIMEIELEAIAPPWTRESFLSEIHMENSFFAVAGTNGINNTVTGINSANNAATGIHLQGFVIMRRIDDDGELLQIAVDKAARRCGIANALVDAALGYAKENNLKSVFLEARESNTAAIALYKKHGFEFVQVRKGYYNNPTENAVVMIKCM
jgi:ribosomal-protein-alanine N-acetyltransferase